MMSAGILTLIFVFAVIGFGVVFMAAEEDGTVSNISFVLLHLSLILMAVFGIGGTCYASYAGEHMTHVEKSGTTPIYSLSAQTNTEGSVSGGLFCISGSCGGVDYYYMMKQKDDGYEKIKVPCSKALIIESTGKPHMDSYSTRMNKDVSKFWFFGDRSQYENVVKYKIYVPKNSVKYEFKPN